MEQTAPRSKRLHELDRLVCLGLRIMERLQVQIETPPLHPENSYSNRLRADYFQRNIDDDPLFNQFLLPSTNDTKPYEDSIEAFQAMLAKEKSNAFPEENWTELEALVLQTYKGIQVELICRCGQGYSIEDKPRTRSEPSTCGTPKLFSRSERIL